MNVVLERIQKRRLCTIGNLRVGDIEVFTLEDPHREVKIKGDTAIPAGMYQLKLRQLGHLHQSYTLRFPEMHRGMIWLQDVPDFEYVYIHCGNTPKDTLGCVLVGMQWSGDSVTRSVEAYKLIYPTIVEAIEHEDYVGIQIVDKWIR